MRHLPHLAVLLTVVFLWAGRSAGQNQPNPGNQRPGDKQAEPTLVGGWRAESISMVMDDGKHRNFSGDGGPVSAVIISEKTFTIRAADKIVAEMSYTVDAKQSPATIDLKSPDGAMVGIYKLEGDRLRMCLNDASRGRPTDINSDFYAGLVLVLRRTAGAPLWMMNADGTDLHLFFWTPEYNHCRTPAWSPDGSKVAFIAIRSLFGEQWADSRLLVVDAAGGKPKELAMGVIPSWSPDGKRIVFLGVGTSPSGICIISADGSDAIQQVDPNAQYAVWSPKRDELVYIAGGNVGVYDLKTQERRMLLDVEYRQIRFNFGWSPDGQWICFKGALPDGRSELALVHREGQAKGFRVLLPSPAAPEVIDFNCHLAWEPNGKRILGSLVTKQNSHFQLHLLDPEGKVPPQRLAGQDPSRSWTNGTWSPDGKRIIFCVFAGDSNLGVAE
jgi:uncharacterized protein (TIGR03067 family)